MLKNLCYILIINLFIKGIISREAGPLRKLGPENGYLIIAGGRQKGILLISCPQILRNSTFYRRDRDMICVTEQFSDNLMNQAFLFENSY